ncbi:MAG TPA: FAD-dependent oxidoreductase [Bacteriovoracaceae bacterium]|nr:FAD-dependent oxidoreductase [Bacteriovoracaceae bacterium]
MTTLAIIGGGITGRSLLYNLAKEKKRFTSIHVFNSDSFAPACSRSSTAVVAKRGVSAGHSQLGDLLAKGFEDFQAHVREAAPPGVSSLLQLSVATKKLEAFHARFPQAVQATEAAFLKLRQQASICLEEAFHINPPVYLEWLLRESERTLPIVLHEDLVMSTEESGERISIRTLNSRVPLIVDQVVFAGGVQNSFWKGLLPDPAGVAAKTVPGSYYQFQNIELPCPSFSLTFDGENLIYSSELNRLLVGSTSNVSFCQLPPTEDLVGIYRRFQQRLELELPDLAAGVIKTGVREKARRREPYVVSAGRTFFIGGMYKNGFTLSLSLTRNFSCRLP